MPTCYGNAYQPLFRRNRSNNYTSPFHLLIFTHLSSTEYLDHLANKCRGLQAVIVTFARIFGKQCVRMLVTIFSGGQINGSSLAAMEDGILPFIKYAPRL
jgi:hypothetical protein